MKKKPQKTTDIPKRQVFKKQKCFIFCLQLKEKFESYM